MFGFSRKDPRKIAPSTPARPTQSVATTRSQTAHATSRGAGDSLATLNRGIAKAGGKPIKTGGGKAGALLAAVGVAAAGAAALKSGRAEASEPGRPPKPSSVNTDRNPVSDAALVTGGAATVGSIFAKSPKVKGAAGAIGVGLMAAGIAGQALMSKAKAADTGSPNSKSDNLDRATGAAMGGTMAGGGVAAMKMSRGAGGRAAGAALALGGIAALTKAASGSAKADVVSDNRARRKAAVEDARRTYAGRTKDSAIAKNIAAKGDKQRRDGRVAAALGVAQTIGGAAVAATGSPIMGGMIAVGGLATMASGSEKLDKGRSTRSRAQAIDNLVNRGKTGNTLGVKRASAPAKSPAGKSSYQKADGSPGKKDYTKKQIAAFQARIGKPIA